MAKELRNKLFSQVLLVISQVGFPLITYPIVTNALGPASLGKVNFVDSLIQLLLILASLGIPLYGIREISSHRNNQTEKSRIFLELFILQLFSAVVILAGLWWIYSTGKADQQLLVIGGIALIGNSLTCDWFLQGNEKFFFLAVRSFLIRMIAAVLIYLLIKDVNDYILYYGILTGTVIVAMILNLLVIIPSLKFTSVKISIWHHLKKIKWIYACYIAASLYAVIDSIILGWMSTETAVGYYSFGYRLIRISAMLIPTLGVVFIPRIAFHFAASNKKEMMNQIADSSQLILFLGVPVSFFFFVLAPEIIEVFAGSKFEPTITICRILSPLPLFIALSHLTGSQVLLSTKKEKIYFIILGIGLLINLLMNVILIPQLVERAPAISNLTVEGFVMLTTILYLRRQKVFHFPFKYLVICILCSLPLFPVTYYFRQTSLDSLSILIFAFLITITLYSIIHLKFLPDSFIRRLFSLKASK